MCAPQRVAACVALTVLLGVCLPVAQASASEATIAVLYPDAEGIYRDLELVAYDASDLAVAAQHFRAIFEHARPDQDGLWIPLDGALIDEQAVWPLIVEQSWYPRVAVFSNDLRHARHGALLALYMDPEKLGQRLAERAPPWRAARSRIIRTSSHSGR